MAHSAFRLAQVNIARLLAPLTDPAMADFVANLAPINAIADHSPGFVWRFQTEDGDATAVRPYEDDRIVINFSVWDGVASLQDFVYRGAHAEIMKRRREWFARLTDVYIALWWVPVEHRPTLKEAVDRMDYLKQHGPTLHAFTFRELFPAPDAAAGTDSVPARSSSL